MSLHPVQPEQGSKGQYVMKGLAWLQLMIPGLLTHELYSPSLRGAEVFFHEPGLSQMCVVQ